MERRIAEAFSPHAIFSDWYLGNPDAKIFNGSF
jgi:hypothetical protein